MRRRGYTFAEILVVAAILAILLGVIGLLLGPPMKARAVEVRIKSDLRQIAMAANQYHAEWDGYPVGPNLTGFPKDVPRRCRGCYLYAEAPKTRLDPAQFDHSSNDTGGDAYIFRWNESYWLIERGAAGRLRYPHDPQNSYLATADFFLRKPRQFQVEEFSGPGQFKIRTRKMPLELGVLQDGSVHWKPDNTNPEIERAACLSILIDELNKEYPR